MSALPSTGTGTDDVRETRLGGELGLFLQRDRCVGGLRSVVHRRVKPAHATPSASVRKSSSQRPLET